MQNVSVHTQLLKFQLQKSKMADSRYLENRKNLDLMMTQKKVSPAYIDF